MMLCCFFFFPVFILFNTFQNKTLLFSLAPGLPPSPPAFTPIFLCKSSHCVILHGIKLGYIRVIKSVARQINVAFLPQRKPRLVIQYKEIIN